VFAVAGLGNTGGTHTPGSGYTQLTTSGSFGFFQYQIFPSAPTNERGVWTSGSSITATSVIAAFKAAAAPAAPPWGWDSSFVPTNDQPTRVVAT
jgi:hypothetical protein